MAKIKQPDMVFDVCEFLVKFGMTNDKIDRKKTKIRTEHMLEEISEFIDATHKGDNAKMLDALVDLVYVALGTAILHRFPFYAAWDAVHKANMLKVRATRKGQSKRGTTFDVVKPDGWKAPDIEKLLHRRTHQARFSTKGC